MLTTRRFDRVSNASDIISHLLGDISKILVQPEVVANHTAPHPTSDPRAIIARGLAVLHEQIPNYEPLVRDDRRILEALVSGTFLDASDLDDARRSADYWERRSPDVPSMVQVDVRRLVDLTRRLLAERRSQSN